MFSQVSETVTARDVRQFLKAEQTTASTTLLYVWDEAVYRNRVVNPSETMNFYPGPADRLFNFVTRKLGGRPFADAFCADYRNELSTDQGDLPFAQFQLVRSYPSDIHIADIVLSDLKRRVENRGQRSHHGLGLFGDFLERLKPVAKSQRAQRISLIPASREATKVFERYGFQPSKAPASTAALNNQGFGHAMILPVE